MADPVLTQENVRALVTGDILVAPVGTALPTDFSTAPNAAFVPLGYFDKDGIEEKPDVTREDFQAYQNNDVVLQLTTKARLVYSAKLIENSVATINAYYAADVDTATGAYVIDVGKSTGEVAVIYRSIDQRGKVKVRTIERAEIFKTSDGVKAVGGTAETYPIEIVCYTKPTVYDEALVASA